jgi:ketosteroid isomerase-like protein
VTESNVEIVQALFAAWEKRQPAAAFERIDPEIEVDLTDLSPIAGASGRGVDELQQLIRDWLETWGSLEYDPRTYIDAGEHVIVLLRAHSLGRGSGAVTEMTGAVVYTIRDGRVIGLRAFETLERAAQWAGI